MVRGNFYFGQTQMSLLEEVSKRTGLPVSEHLRRALDLYLNHWGRQAAAGLAATVGPVIDKLPEKG